MCVVCVFGIVWENVPTEILLLLATRGGTILILLYLSINYYNNNRYLYFYNYISIINYEAMSL